MGGLSIGINFNTNNACNWRCIYCQVPDLKIGAAPKMDFELLEKELRYFLKDVKEGDFYDRYQVDADKRVIKDIAIAGNGEPTSLKDFAAAVELIGKIATEAGVFPDSHYVLITNGSLIHQTNVQAGLSALKSYGGEVWFKLDSATEEGRALINHSGQSSKASLKNLLLSASLCPTKLQTCLVDYDEQGFSDKERLAFLDLFKSLKQLDCQLEDILLYTIARPSLQPEAPRIRPLDTTVLNDFAAEIRLLDYKVSVTA
ncbi:MAG: radical SAM protein [Methylococcales bacterium]|nr:MAG: radical SAM protein [Methylococcales bacterium]